MYKKVILGSLVLFLAVGLVFGFGVLSSFAQEEEKEGETITITTYYPSPYGVYNELQSNKLAVGDTNDDGELTALDLPNRDGDIRLRPQPGNPDNWDPGEEGQFAYSKDEEALYHWSDFESKWVKQAGAGTAVISLKCKWWCFRSWAGGIFFGSASCEPPSCPSDWTDLGTGCVCTSMTDATDSTTPHNCAGYCERWCKEE